MFFGKNVLMLFFFLFKDAALKWLFSIILSMHPFIPDFMIFKNRNSWIL